MKVIELNRRYLAYRRYGHTVGIRWDQFWDDHNSTILPRKMGVACTDTLGAAASLRYGNVLDDNRWCEYFGTAKRRGDPRPYYITFRNRQDMLMAMMRVEVST